MPQPYHAPVPRRWKRWVGSRHTSTAGGTRQASPRPISVQHVDPVTRYAGSRRNSEAMSAITRCQSIAGSAAAATSPAGAAARADTGRLLRLAQHPRKGRRDALDLPVGHLREERQRERPRGDVLAHRELALAVAERLAVVRHEVDRGQVGLARDAVLVAQRPEHAVARVGPRDLDDVDEPPADVAAGVRCRQPEALDAGERLAVAPGDARAVREHAV